MNFMDEKKTIFESMESSSSPPVNWASHKEQKYLLGTQSHTHTYKLIQHLILSYAH